MNFPSLTTRRLLAVLFACTLLSACGTTSSAAGPGPVSSPRVVERDLSGGVMDRASR